MLQIFSEEIARKFEIFDWRNASAILQSVHPVEFSEIVAVLSQFELKKSDIEQAGGNKSSIAKRIDSLLCQYGWIEKKFDTKILVDGHSYESPTHKIDCFKGKIALEVEWNNKDPFFDRDLNNFRLLYDLRVIDLGVLITRATSLKDVLKSSNRTSSTYGPSTTHTEKLYPKIRGGCPVLVFGIKAGAYRNDL
jgi:hypothetical protein